MPTQILTEEQKNAIRLLPMGKKHGVRIMIERMEVGQHLRISREDFKWKRKTPGMLCLAEAKRSGKDFLVMKEVGKTGWVVTRTK